MYDESLILTCIFKDYKVYKFLKWSPPLNPNPQIYKRRLEQRSREKTNKKSQEHFCDWA